MNFEKASMLQSTPSESTAAEDRSTTFQPTEGGSEQRSGATLLVEAYAVIWTLLMLWLVRLWRKQAALNLRIDGLESAILKAGRGPGGHPASESRPAVPLAEPSSSAAKAPAGKLGGQPS
jgi:CcmD family protein